MELRTVRFLYNSLQFLAAEQNPVWSKTWQYILLGKKENNGAEKEGFLYASLPPPSCLKQRKYRDGTL